MWLRETVGTIIAKISKRDNKTATIYLKCGFPFGNQQTNMVELYLGSVKNDNDPKIPDESRKYAEESWKQCIEVFN